MATQRTTHRVGVDSSPGVTETPLSPVATTLPRHDRDDGTVNDAGAPFYLQGYQTRANMSPEMGGLPRHLGYRPSNFPDTQPCTQYHTPLNNQWQSQQRTVWQSFNATTQSPAHNPQSNFHPMSPTTATVRTDVNHTFAGTDAEVRPDIINLPPVGPFLRGRAKPQMSTMPRDPPTFTMTSNRADGKRYLCQCGRRTKTVGDMERHHESSKHSEPKHGCACGKMYSRKDSLTRHKKKCAMQI